MEISSLRVGSEIGTHEVIVDGPMERLTFTHEAKDRKVFALGAIKSAEWLIEGNKKGTYRCADYLMAMISKQYSEA